MKIAIRKEPNGIFYIDKTALKRLDEKTLSQPPYNFSFTEVDVEDFEYVDFDYNETIGFTFSQQKYQARKQRQNNYYKLKGLENWFNTYFDKQLNQSMWQSDFEVSADPYFKDENGDAKTYASIEELKAQASEVRELIKQYRKTLEVVNETND